MTPPLGANKAAIMGSAGNVDAPVDASGGTKTTAGTYTVHKFT